MEKEVLKLEHDYAMEHVKGNRKMSGPVIIKLLVQNPGKVDSGPVGVTGVLALVHVKKLLRIDGEIVNPVGINAMDKTKKLLHVQCITVTRIIQTAQKPIGKINLEHGKIGQVGQIVQKHVAPDSFIDLGHAIGKLKDAKIRNVLF